MSSKISQAMISSVEMPSSYIEPSIVFDEKEGKGDYVNLNQYNFKPIVNKENRPKMWTLRLTEGWQIKQKECSFDSPNEISFSDSWSNDSNLFISNQNEIQISPQNIKESDKLNFSESRKRNELVKGKLKDYVTQMDENFDLFGHPSSHK